MIPITATMITAIMMKMSMAMIITITIIHRAFVASPDLITDSIITTRYIRIWDIMTIITTTHIMVGIPF